MAAIILSLIISTILIVEGDANSYHVTFLGRDHSQSLDEKIGELIFWTKGDAPTITSYQTICTDVVPTGHILRKATLDSFSCLDIIPNGNELARKGVKVASNDEFTLHIYQTDSDGNLGDGYLAIPDEHLGDEYYVVTYCTLGGMCQFAITAIEDETEIGVVFPNPITQSAACVNGMPISSSAQAGTAVSFLINEYETLHFEGPVDFTGVYITASKKVAVVVGARDVPAAGATYNTTSNMIEQIIPVNKWGNEFVVIPNQGNLAGDVIVIITKTDNTAVRIIGSTPFVIPKAGGSVVKRIDWQVHSAIHTSNPVMILQIMSVDLYNDTNGVTGLPSMVLVPHIGQWISEEIYFYCEQQVDSLFALVTTNEDKVGVQIISYSGPKPPPPEWISVEASEYSVYVAEELGILFTIHRGTVGGYGYCNNNSAFLLGADWSRDNTECIPTTPVPGDNVDNDCNGQIDEEDCTTDDLVTRFTSSQDRVTGGVTYKTFNVQGINSVTFTVTTCDIAIIQLRTTSTPVKTLTITISHDKYTFVNCAPECSPMVTKSKHLVGTCKDAYTYSLAWVGRTLLVHSSEYANIAPAEEYDKLIMSAFVGSATFDVSVLEKDCSKLYLGDGEPDSFGMEFLIPVFDTDKDFQIVLTNSGDTDAAFTLLTKNDIVDRNLSSRTSRWIKKSDITTTTYTGIKLTIQNGTAVSVYVIKVNLGTTGFSVIPTDVLGSSYHMYEPSRNIASICDVFALSSSTTVTGLGTIVEDGFKGLVPASVNTEDLSYRRLIQGERPVSVFCGTYAYSFTHMPPPETLGKKHYIPAIDLDALPARGQINIVATEDSTIVIIKGDYDQLDSVMLTGEAYYRDIEPLTIYEIEATKPIQVHLELIALSALYWESITVIPTVEQYKEDFTMIGFDGAPLIFPVFNPLPGFLKIFAISDNGTMIDVDASGGLPIQPYTVRLGAKAFVMAFIIRLSLVNHGYVVLTNQQNYKDINELCVMTPSVPGDGIDNDCDGLMDEEDCTVDKTPGDIDSDIDGSINEDCAAGTTAPTDSDIALDLDFDEIPCSTGSPRDAPSGGSGSTSGNEIGGTSTGIVIGGTTGVFKGKGAVPQVYKTIGTVPELEIHVAVPIPSIDLNIPTTTPGPGSTGTHEEACLIDSLCPCGWVDTHNYTAAEIEEKVVKLVEKLTISKHTLSATIRKKISAGDNRRSATTVGYVAVVWLVVMFGAVVVLDVSSIVRDLKMLVHNVRHVFQR